MASEMSAAERVRQTRTDCGTKANVVQAAAAKPMLSVNGLSPGFGGSDMEQLARIIAAGARPVQRTRASGAALPPAALPGTTRTLRPAALISVLRQSHI